MIPDYNKLVMNFLKVGNLLNIVHRVCFVVKFKLNDIMTSCNSLYCNTVKWFVWG